MTIDSIREQIADKLSSSAEYESWVEILEHTNPGHYGVNDINVSIGIKNIWVEIPQKTFTFKNVGISFDLRLGGSSEKNGYDANFEKAVSGFGHFEFSPNDSQVNIKNFEINEQLDLYGRE